MATPLSIDAVLELVGLGFTADEIRAYAAAPDGAQASAPVKAAKPPKSAKAKAAAKKAGLAYVAARKARRVARRALAVELRAKGITPNGEAWVAAKASAGI